MFMTSWMCRVDSDPSRRGAHAKFERQTHMGFSGPLIFAFSLCCERAWISADICLVLGPIYEPWKRQYFGFPRVHPCSAPCLVFEPAFWASFFVKFMPPFRSAFGATFRLEPRSVFEPNLGKTFMRYLCENYGKCRPEYRTRKWAAFLDPRLMW